MRGLRIRVAATVVLMATVAACVERQNIGPGVPITPVMDLDPAKLAPIELQRVVINVPPGSQIGVSYDDMLCGGMYVNGAIHRNLNEVNDSPLLRAAFYEEMERIRFNLAGNPKKLFAQENDRAEFILGAEVTRIVLNVCERVNLLNGFPLGRQSGDGLIDVRWQVFSNAEQRVVHTTTTQGYARQAEAVPGGPAWIFRNAFAAAAGRLAGDAKFVGLLRRDQYVRNADPAPVADETLRIARIPLHTDPIARNAALVRNAAVTILIGEHGHGSGFFITNEGHVLTNHHVVGDAKVIPVRLSNGTTLSGRVLRSHAARDVALVKIDAVDTRALPLRMKPVDVLEEVYAIGTPIARELSTTVTKGIVSAERRSAPGTGLPRIQADVAIQGGSSGGPLLDAAGNVVGIAVAGVSGANKRNAGLNFFIPIEDALEKLRIEIKS